MIKSRIKKKQLYETGVNNSILNIITPSGLEFNKNSLVKGDSYGKCMAITKYPKNPEFGWLSSITAIEGTTASVVFKPTETGELITRCNEQIKQYRKDIQTINEESERQEKEKAIDDIKIMIKRINEDGEVVGYVNILLMIEASTEKKLEDRVKKVISTISTYSFHCRTVTFNQKEAYSEIAPFGIPLTLEDFSERNMPMSAFIGGFINSSNGINDGTGYLLGKTEIRNNQAIIDTWRRGGDRTNSNWLITGLPGVGKSGSVKTISIYEYALGAKLIFIDPEQEYIELVKNLGGDIINCGGGKGGKINPLQVRVVPKLDSDSKDDEELLYRDEGTGMGDLALYFQTLRTFFRLYIRDMSDILLAKLEEVLENLYAKHHITWDTDISLLRNDEFPIMEELYNDLIELYKKTNDKDYENLRLYIRSAAIGADACLWNGYTDMETNAGVVDLDISALQEADEKVKKAQYYNILTWAWQRVAIDRNERILIIVDEAYLLVDPEIPQPLIFLRNVSKRIRKYEGGLLVITHSVDDLLNEKVKMHGQAIIDNSCFKLLMGTDGKNLKETKELFDLTEQEETTLLSQQRGKGILFAGSKRITLKIEIPTEIMKMFGSAGGR